MRFLKLQLRFLVPLIITLIIGSVVVLGVMDRLALRWFSRDLHMRGSLLASAFSDSIADSLATGQRYRLEHLFERTVKDERLVAVALCLPADVLGLHSSAYPAELSCKQATVIAAQTDPSWQSESGPVHIGVYPVSSDSVLLGKLVLLHDLKFVERRTGDARRQLLMFVLGLGFAILLITMVVAQMSWRGWISSVRGILHRDGHDALPGSTRRELEPFIADLRLRLRDLEDEYRLAQGSDVQWTAERLRTLLRTQLSGDEIIVVSNREPYIHEWQGEQTIVRRPASGLVTAVEPVMRACSGTWIAHGSGSADREFVDAHDRLMLPPGHKDYALRRIWLSDEEVRGYYNGFANEGLWPLCHMVHIRPTFRESDWETYRAVNQRFADAVVAEAHSDDPVILVQDYHFALLPAMIRERLPRATILAFWHIPWPNPESFGICPWRREILQGMLGSTILGFQTRNHSQNFIEAVDRYLEARVEHEHSTISFRGETSFVESYPISIEWPGSAASADWPSPQNCRDEVFSQLGLRAGQRVILGVDRFDYTKGIIERLQAFEHLLQHNPQWIGEVSLLQIAAPTRSALADYQGLHARVHDMVAALNARFGRAGYTPVILQNVQHDQRWLARLYRAAAVCVVSSLHDGMNLVSKEFVAARDDEQGVLILSRFTGAARELSEALLVNPYHVEDVAQAMQRALNMPADEQRERLASMRMTVQEFNVFRWAGHILSDASRWRLRERIEARVRRRRED